MKIHTIEGEIEAMGVWHKKKLHSMKKYDYISFRTNDGQDVVVRNISVFDEVDRLLFPATDGAFIIIEGWFSKEMVAARTDDREAICEFLHGSTTKYYLKGLGLLLFGLMSSIVLIGIPLVFIALWMLAVIGPMKRKLLDATRNAGFRHVATKII
jgi:hypothetical protein